MTLGFSDLGKIDQAVEDEHGSVFSRIHLVHEMFTIVYICVTHMLENGTINRKCLEYMCPAVALGFWHSS